jgi:hypothetical protein
MMKPAAVAVVVLALVSLPTFAQQKAYYRWTDASGAVHYADTPPPDKTAKTVNVSTGKSMSAAAPVPKTTADPSTQSKLEAGDAAYRKKACDTGQSDLKTLDHGGMVVDSGNPDEARKLSAEQRDAARETATARVKEFCGQGTSP